MKGIGNIIVGIVFIIGGLSGQLVLIGTNSGELLAVVGGALIVLGIFRMAKGGGDDAPAVHPKLRVGQASVTQDATVYSDKDSRSPAVSKLGAGTKVEIVGVTEINDVQWVNVKLIDGQQGFLLGHAVRQ
jgi:hypothetical protein